jgi:hypothetical protein
MALRKPLVIVNGQVQQIQSGDTLDAIVNEVDITQATNNEATTLVIGTPVYVDGAGTVKEAQADALITSRVLGLVQDVTIAAAAAGDIQTDGVFVATTTQWDAVAGTTGGLSPGVHYFLSAATAGLISATAPTTTGEVVVNLGLALSATELDINNMQSVLL